MTWVDFLRTCSRRNLLVYTNPFDLFQVPELY